MQHFIYRLVIAFHNEWGLLLKSLIIVAILGSITSVTKANDCIEIHDERSLCCPKAIVSERAPCFEGTAVLNYNLRHLTLRQFRGKYVVLVFYPLDFASICPTEIIALSDRMDDFHQLNAVVIACSVDSPYAHLTWTQLEERLGGVGNTKVILLSDSTHKIGIDYGVYDENLGFFRRGLFIIDKRGILRYTVINDLSIGRSVNDTLRMLEAIRYVDKTGDFLPANWGE